MLLKNWLQAFWESKFSGHQVRRASHRPVQAIPARYRRLAATPTETLETRVLLSGTGEEYLDNNNSPAQAYDLDDGLSGSDWSSIHIFHEGLHQTTDPEDYYRFTVQAGDMTDFKVELTDLTAAVEIEIWEYIGGDLGNLMGSVAAPDDHNIEYDLELVVQALGSGDYIIRMALKDSVAEGTATDFQLDLFRSDFKNISPEPNDTPAQAVDLGTLPLDFEIIDDGITSYLSSTDSVDFYRFEVAENQSLNVDFYLNSRGGGDYPDWELAHPELLVAKLWASNNGELGELLYTAEYDSESEISFFYVEGLPAGEYFLEVATVSPPEEGELLRYHLEFSSTMLINHDVEPNSTAEQAQDLKLIPDYEGYRYDYYSLSSAWHGTLHGTSDRQDWYSFSIEDAEDGLSNMLWLDIDGFSQTVKFRVWTNNGGSAGELVAESEVDFYETYDSDLDDYITIEYARLDLDGIAGGDYFLEVVLDDEVIGDVETNYILLAGVYREFLPDVEPNDTYETAFDLGHAPSDVTFTGTLTEGDDIVDYYRFRVDGIYRTFNTQFSLYSDSDAVLHALWRIVDGEKVELISDGNLYYGELEAGEYLIEIMLDETANPDQVIEYQAYLTMESEVIAEEYDDNSPATATYLGDITYSTSDAYVSTLNSTTDRLDTYRFEVPLDHMANATLTLDNLIADTTLRVYRLQGDKIVALVAESRTAGLAAESIQLENLMPGEYLIEVVLDSSVAADTTTPYRLVVAGEISVYFDENYEDASPAGATYLGAVLPEAPLQETVGSYLDSTYDKVDTYRFVIGEENLADVNIRLDGFTLNTNLRLYRLYGNTIVSLVAESKLPGGQPEAINVNDLPPGEYLIEVVLASNVSPDLSTEYRLSVHAESSVLALENAADGTVAGATNLGVATPEAPLDLYQISTLHKTDDRADNYRFTIGTGHLSNINIQLDSFTADATLRLYRLNGNTIVSLIEQSVSAGATPESISAENLPPGDYLIEVILTSHVSANIGTSYRLHVQTETSVLYTNSPADQSAAGATSLGTFTGGPLETLQASTLERTTDRVDTYRFGVATGQFAQMNLLLDNLVVNTNIRLYRVNGNTIELLIVQSTDGWAAQKSLFSPLLSEGEYLIEVVLGSNVSAGIFADYRLFLNLTEAIA